MVQPTLPYSKSEILEALSSAESEVAGFFGSLSDEELTLRVGDTWTPTEHLQHLNTSVSAVARGFSMPPLLLRLRFGRARAPSRTFEQVRDAYRAQLEAGGRSTAEFEPPREKLSAAEANRRKAELLARWSRVNARLRVALEKWKERSLEGILLPHPLMGKLTAREMLLFTLYHNGHHMQGVMRRLPRFAEAQER